MKNAIVAIIIVVFASLAIYIVLTICGCKKKKAAEDFSPLETKVKIAVIPVDNSAPPYSAPYGTNRYRQGD